MSANTAFSIRPNTVQMATVTVDLVPAIAEDLKVLDYCTEDGTPVYKLRFGLVYWLYSHIDNEIQSTPYIVDEYTDPKELKEYLDAEQIYIPRSPFKH